MCVFCLNLALKHFNALRFYLALWMLDTHCPAFSRKRSSGTITCTVNTSSYPFSEGGENTAWLWKYREFLNPCVKMSCITLLLSNCKLTMCIIIHVHLPIFTANWWIGVLITSFNKVLNLSPVCLDQQGKKSCSKKKKTKIEKYSSTLSTDAALLQHVSNIREKCWSARRQISSPLNLPSFIVFLLALLHRA